MKLPELSVCYLSCSFGNPEQMTVMGEVLTDGLSDGGSTPPRSIHIKRIIHCMVLFVCPVFLLLDGQGTDSYNWERFPYSSGGMLWIQDQNTEQNSARYCLHI